MEVHPARVLKIAPDGSSNDWFVGVICITESGGVISELSFDVEPDERNYIEQLGDLFPGPNSPLILKFRVKGESAHVRFASDSEGGWIDPEEMTEKEFREKWSFAHMAAVRLIQRCRQGEPILVVPEPLDPGHPLLAKRHDPYSILAVKLTAAPPLRRK